jgi:hypothetical protein
MRFFASKHSFPFLAASQFPIKISNANPYTATKILKISPEKLVVGKSIQYISKYSNERASFFIPFWRIPAKASLYLNINLELPQDIFNYPLRRDLIYRLYNFRINLDKFNSKVTRNRAMTHGSRIKMRPQKGQGRARMGDKRAPHLYKGGKSHGSKAKVYSYPLNAKIKINALKALLSAKLAEGKIKIIDSEVIS